MKFLIVVAMVLGPLSMVAQVTPNSTKPHFVKPAIDTVVSRGVLEMKAALNLTSDQEEKIKKLTVEHMKARASISAGKTRSQRNEEFQFLQQRFENVMKEILTPQQYKVYSSEMEERKKKYEQKREQLKPEISKG